MCTGISFHSDFCSDLLNLNEREQHKVLAVFCFSLICKNRQTNKKNVNKHQETEYRPLETSNATNIGSGSARILIRTVAANHPSGQITITPVLLSKPPSSPCSRPRMQLSSHCARLDVKPSVLAVSGAHLPAYAGGGPPFQGPEYRVGDLFLGI